MISVYAAGQQPVPGYRLVRFLGRGGFGEVWEALAPGGASAALKMIPLIGRPGQKELKAIRLMKRVNHPNLIPMHALWLRDHAGNLLDDRVVDQSLGLVPPDPSTSTLAKSAVAPLGALDVDDNTPTELIMAMGLGQRSLWDRLEECKRQGLPGIPIDELIRCLEDAARALDYLNARRHDLGNGLVSIQHCDVKPQNILQVGDAAQVCDFGLARVLGENSARLSFAGTLTGLGFSAAYAAPETLDDRGATSRTDQYSLAVTYYELRTGQLPFRNMSAAAMIEAHCRGQLSYSDVTIGEAQVLRRATHLNPVERFPSCAEMMRALVNALADESSLSMNAPRPKVFPQLQTQEIEPPSGSGNDFVLDDDVDPFAAQAGGSLSMADIDGDITQISSTRSGPVIDETPSSAYDDVLQSPPTAPASSVGSSEETEIPHSNICRVGFYIAPGCRLDRLLGSHGRDSAWRAVGDQPGREVMLQIRNLTPETSQYVDVALLTTLKGEALRHANLFNMRTFWLLDAQGHSIEQDFRSSLNSGQAVKLVLAGRYCEDNLLERLSERCEKGQTFGPAESLVFLKQIADALDFLNAKRHLHVGRLVSIQHQNATLFNCWFTNNGVLRLGNPCEARAMTESYCTLRGEGDAPQHELIAPEVRAGWLSNTSDQFTLALMYVQLRSGLLPWQASDLRTELLEHLQTPSRNLVALFPYEIDAVLRATSDDPNDRFATCREFATALSTAAPTNPVATPFRRD